MDAGNQKLNVIFSTDCIKYPLTGIGRYAFELAKQLESRNDQLSLTYLHGISIRKKLAVAEESSKAAQSIKQQVKKSKIASEVYRLTVPYAKSLVLRKFKKQIFHSPNYYLPPRIKCSVATIHDLSVFHWPQFHPAGRVMLLQKELINSVKSANALITDSHFTKKEVVDFFGLEKNKVVVAPLACNADFHQRNESEVQLILNKYNLRWKSYFLYTGTIEPRKNILTLLKAYDSLSAIKKKNFPLVISGYNGWDNEELFRLFRKGQNEGWLKYLGFVPGNDLPALYSAANSFVFPSIYEGFGLPVLEAMASGTPVICSNVSSLPEVVGNAALTHDPQDVDNLSYYLRMMIEDIDKRQLMIDSGLARAKQFTWSLCADKTIEAYKQVAESL